MYRDIHPGAPITERLNQFGHLPVPTSSSGYSSTSLDTSLTSQPQTTAYHPRRTQSQLNLSRDRRTGEHFDTRRENQHNLYRGPDLITPHHRPDPLHLHPACRRGSREAALTPTGVPDACVCVCDVYVGMLAWPCASGTTAMPTQPRAPPDGADVRDTTLIPPHACSTVPLLRLPSPFPRACPFSPTKPKFP
ncbi:hypothetical protein B0H67DRAFT_579360 [Lasiosphaeris hirsuta]|uniref:Uncharacterized protein n=1 Tax=Lasiosphaeris hirsuta TaxID=260670 RepID=A0AA40AFH0_9PEZI|nr:hypothetical protein B0H67DRAFT_579360 [Lasiosphaeris hirsuta]